MKYKKLGKKKNEFGQYVLAGALTALFFVVVIMITGNSSYSLGTPSNPVAQVKIDTPKQPVLVAPSAPAISATSLPDSFMLPQLTWIPQTFNNCGPATTAMILEHFGIEVSQATTKADLRTNPDDKNVFTYEISDYLKNKYNINSRLLYNGNAELLKRLASNGYYVIVENLFKPNDDIGHEIIIRGYDNTTDTFTVEDPYYGPSTEITYADFELEWKGFNHEYMPVYLPKDESQVRQIIGDDFETHTMYQHAVEANLSATKKDPSDMYSWFSLGTSYFGLGQYDLAVSAYEKSRALGWPARILWYQIQPVKAYNEIGQYTKALELARIGLVDNDSFAELHYESARALKGLGKMDEAKTEATRTLELDPNYQAAKDLLSSL